MSQLTIVDLDFCHVEFSGNMNVQGGDGFGISFGGISPVSSFVASANASNTSGYLATYSVNRNGFTATLNAGVSGAVAGALAGATFDGTGFTTAFTTAVTV